MENTKTLNVISTPNIEGNIGSCEVKSTQFSKGFWKSETVAVNSCTGQIIADNIYVDSAPILLIGLASLIFFGVIIDIMSESISEHA